MIKDNKLYYPSSSGETLVADLTRVFAADARIAELAIVNSEKAPELDAAFLQGYSDLVDAHARVSLELYRIETMMERRSAIILLDKMGEIVETKKVSGNNADIRRAVISLDVEYQTLQDKYDALRAFESYLKQKQMALAMAHGRVSQLSEKRIVYNHSAELMPFKG